MYKEPSAKLRLKKVGGTSHEIKEKIQDSVLVLKTTIIIMIMIVMVSIRMIMIIL